MRDGEIKLLGEPEREFVLARLRRNCPKYSHVIEDLLRWPRRSRFYYIDGEGALSFLHVSGHPAIRTPFLILDGEPEKVDRLLRHVQPHPPFIVSETLAELADVVTGYYPQAEIFEAWRMTLTPRTYRKTHRGVARQLTESDLPALEDFFGERAKKLRVPYWLRSANAFYGVFEGDQIVSLGSSMISLPDIWTLVSVETRPEYRGRGFATEITSSLVERALQETDLVALSVVCTNAPAIRIYEKIGFEKFDRCLWADCGADAKP